MILLILLPGCSHRFFGSGSTTLPAEFDWQGHRGCRGLMPENTIPAFIEALNYPVTTLELDVVVSADRQLIVSHEPWMDPKICLTRDSQAIPGDGRQFNLYQMTADEIREFDCGSKINKKFPDQVHVPAFKPTLREVVVAVRAACMATGREMPKFNIELKSHPAMYDSYIPLPEDFVRMVLHEITFLSIQSATTLQSFDLNVLREIEKQGGEEVSISFLATYGRDLDQAISKLGFEPAVYSPHHRLVSKTLLKQANSQGIRVIPWTVNKVGKMRKLIDRGVHGLITDYPDRIKSITSADR